MGVAPSRARRAEQELLIRYSETGDLGARKELVARFLPFARDLALRYSYTGEPVEDLVQVACIGLLKAIDRYEPGRGTRFTSSSREGERLGKQLGRSASVREVAAAVGCSSEELLEAYEAANSYEAVSLDVPASSDNDDGGTLLDLVGSGDDGYTAVAEGGARRRLARTAEPGAAGARTALVGNMTQREIGEVIGFSQMHVSRLLRRALSRLESATA